MALRLTFLGPEDFEAAFHWKYDRDPFDPEGAIASVEPPMEGEPVQGEKVPNTLAPR